MQLYVTASADHQRPPMLAIYRPVIDQCHSSATHIGDSHRHNFIFFSLVGLNVQMKNIKVRPMERYLKILKTLLLPIINHQFLEFSDSDWWWPVKCSFINRGARIGRLWITAVMIHSNFKVLRRTSSSAYYYNTPTYMRWWIYREDCSSMLNLHAGSQRDITSTQLHLHRTKSGLLPKMFLHIPNSNIIISEYEAFRCIGFSAMEKRESFEIFQI